MRNLVLSTVVVFVVVGPTARAQENAKSLPVPIRISSGMSGHIHPAACITKKGTIVVIYSQVDRYDLLVTRSSDGGKTWSVSEPFPHTIKVAIYPGSLTTLPDGRIVHCWNQWYTDERKFKSRWVLYSISGDEGRTWSEPVSLAKNKIPSIIRHPLVVLGEDAWLMSLADRTIIYHPRTGAETTFGDGLVHGLVPIVRTPKGTFVSGAGRRSTDGGKTWQKVTPFPDIATQGWRYELMCLDNGWLLATQILGPGIGGARYRFVLSRDDGQRWDMDGAIEYYNPGRAITGRGCPRTLQIDEQTIGTVFYDLDEKQPGGPGLFFLRMPLSALRGSGNK